MTTPEEHDQFMQDLMLNAPESWDGEESIETIALAYVRKLEQRLAYLGSTLERFDAAGADMNRPYFVIKCTDRFAQQALRSYELTVGAAGNGEKGREQAAQVRLAWTEMRTWQQANPGEVHFPDHEHQPAVG